MLFSVNTRLGLDSSWGGVSDSTQTPNLHSAPLRKPLKAECALHNSGRIMVWNLCSVDIQIYTVPQPRGTLGTVIGRSPSKRLQGKQ